MTASIFRDGLWALAFGTDPSANGRKNQLFFTAGPLFYELTPKTIQLLRSEKS